MAASTDATGVPSDTDKRQLYSTCTSRIVRLIEGEDDLVAVQATVVCELHHAMPHFHWTGFYRAVGPDMLAVGPYQGGSACLRIPHSKGVCGAAATTGDTQLVRDVHTFPGHIACSSSTMSEIVVPVKASDGRLLAVLDIDSDFPAAFSETDQQALEQLCRCIGGKLYRTGTVEWGGSS